MPYSLIGRFTFFEILLHFFDKRNLDREILLHQAILNWFRYENKTFLLNTITALKSQGTSMWIDSSFIFLIKLISTAEMYLLGFSLFLHIFSALLGCVWLCPEQSCMPLQNRNDHSRKYYFVTHQDIYLDLYFNTLLLGRYKYTSYFTLMLYKS